METPEIESSHLEKEFAGESGLIRRFSEDGEVVHAIINGKLISLLAEKFVAGIDDSPSLTEVYGKFKEVQKTDDTHAPFTVVKTVDNPTPEDYERELYTKEWCLEYLGAIKMDMRERDENLK